MITWSPSESSNQLGSHGTRARQQLSPIEVEPPERTADSLFQGTLLGESAGLFFTHLRSLNLKSSFMSRGFLEIKVHYCTGWTGRVIQNTQKHKRLIVFSPFSPQELSHWKIPPLGDWATTHVWSNLYIFHASPEAELWPGDIWQQKSDFRRWFCWCGYSSFVVRVGVNWQFELIPVLSFLGGPQKNLSVLEDTNTISS